MPLLNPPRPPVKPNLMITLDDSGSMGLLYMPDGTVDVGVWRVASPAAGHYVGFDPDDADALNNVWAFEGVFTADPDSTSWVQRAMRSPDTNTLFYNPDVRYRPWLQADGSRFPEADIQAALLHPTLKGARAIDLSRNLTEKSAKWCTNALEAGKPAGCALAALPYSPALYYRLKREKGNFMNPAEVDSYLVFDANAPGGLPRGPNRSDCVATTCTQAEEQRNFANWFVYHRSRLHLAKAVLGETLGQLPNQIRLGVGNLSSTKVNIDGLGEFNYIMWGVRDLDAARKTVLLNWVYSQRPGGLTPLGGAMHEVGRYYEVSDSRGPWGATPGTLSNAPADSCRLAHHLMITDGYWTSSSGRTVGNVDATEGPAVGLADGTTWQYTPQAPFRDDNVDYLADIAMYYWNRDLQPTIPNHRPARPGNEAAWQSMSNFIVGLGVKGTLNPATDLIALTQGEKKWGTNRIDDLWHAALNSRGAYFSATDTQSLAASLKQALLAVIPIDRSQAGVAVASREQVEGNRKYLAHYRASDWSGDLRAYAAKEKGDQIWSAEQSLPAWENRKIYIRDENQPAPTAVPFVWDRFSQSLKVALGTHASAHLVDYLRGDRSHAVENGWRERSSLLGDFIHSTPVISSATADTGLSDLPGSGSSYAEFVSGVKQSRPRVVYVGGNAGMLHVFRDEVGSDGAPAGQEIYAYIPRAVAGQLPLLASNDYAGAQHRYFVDGPLQQADVHVPPPGGGGATWRSYLFGSTGAGPAAVFALDVTRPDLLDAASARWEIRAETEPKLGHVLSPVASGQLPNGRWVALFGNGYGSASKKAHLFVVDVASGAVSTVELPSSGQAANGLGGVALQKNGVGQVEGLYAGDLSGRLWRFDFSETATAYFTLAFNGQPLFEADAGQPIVQAPLIRKRGGNTYVVVGTGQLVTAADAIDETVQAVYLVEDRSKETLPHPLRTSQLTEWTLARFGAADQVSAGPQVPGQSATPVGRTLFTVTGNSRDAPADSRGWRAALTGVDVPKKLRVLQPLQAIQDQFLVGAEAPADTEAQRNSNPCGDTFEGEGVNLLFSMASSPVSKKPVLDTNADGVINSQDIAGVIGYAVAADGADAAAAPQPSGAATVPAGSASGVASPAPIPLGQCANTVNLLGANGSMAACLVKAGLGTLRDRVWRRILQPPF